MSAFKFSKFLVLLTIVGIFTSCETDDGPKGAYENGTYIVNEGAFGGNNASLSFYNYGTDEVTNNVFTTENKRPLGDVAQSLTVHEGKAYIVVNNSNKVEVVDQYTCEQLGVIEEIVSPRFMTASGNKGYITSWGDNSVKVIDLSTKSVTKSIKVGSAPEGLVISDNKLFVANSGFGFDSTVSVIDLDTEEVVGNVGVAFSPKGIVADNQGKIWTLCHGQVLYDSTFAKVGETPSALCKIDMDESMVVTYTLFDDQHPSILQIDNNGSTLFFGGGFGFSGIYKFEESGSQGTYTKLIDEFAYGFTYDKTSGNIFVGVAPNFTSAGKILRYSTAGEKLGEYTAGIGPNGTSLKKAE